MGMRTDCSCVGMITDLLPFTGFLCVKVCPLESVAAPLGPHLAGFLSSSNAGACYAKQDPERGGSHMISTDDLEYPREYRTLGNSARRFSNVGLVHTSEHRHTVTAAQSLEALTNLHKVDMERKRDAFMDHLKSKYQQQQQQLQHPHHSPHHTPPSPSPSHASMRGTSERAAREQTDMHRMPELGLDSTPVVFMLVVVVTGAAYARQARRRLNGR
ncbi:hypothetical protein NQZ68_005734 [Dissostichus eleginoides]|nr:hypothetical protein NQZ68_005734 [Dissostichus eleginoides]